MCEITTREKTATEKTATEKRQREKWATENWSTRKFGNENRDGSKKGQQKILLSEITKTEMPTFAAEH